MQEKPSLISGMRVIKSVVIFCFASATPAGTGDTFRVVWGARVFLSQLKGNPVASLSSVKPSQRALSGGLGRFFFQRERFCFTSLGTFSWLKVRATPSGDWASAPRTEWPKGKRDRWTFGRKCPNGWSVGNLKIFKFLQCANDLICTKSICRSVAARIVCVHWGTWVGFIRRDLSLPVEAWVKIHLTWCAPWPGHSTSAP